MVCVYPRVLLKKSGHPTPRVELDEIGPSLDLVVRRTHLASTDLYKEACKVPKATKVISMDICKVLIMWGGGGLLFFKIISITSHHLIQ